jgi:hypothetical protein
MRCYWCFAGHFPRPERHAPTAKPSSDHIPLGGLFILNPATFHCDNGVDYLESCLEPQ